MMLRTFPQTRDLSQSRRLIGIVAFTMITIIAARLKIPMEPVPFTMQPFAVLLAGMILGSRDGALSQAAYVGLIALGLPFDANMRGTAALFGATGGYLIGFIVAAGVVGLLVERAGSRFWQRWLAGIVGIVIIYIFGIYVLKNVTAMDWSAAWSSGVGPFLVPDMIKAVIAAGIAEGGRTLLGRFLNPQV
ncbi:MAG: biotin transporter BioY [Chitinophagaceae bacterium]|nr:biotin transporter BioY [Anaerolineae bacterium]